MTLRVRAVQMVILLGVVLLILANLYPPRSWVTKAQAEKREGQLRAISQMAANHNAVKDWRQGLLSDLTIHLQDALLRKDGRPVLLDVNLMDIRREGARCVAEFVIDTSMPTMVGKQVAALPDMQAVVLCSSEQVDRLVGKTPRHVSLSGFAIVVRVSAVEHTPPSTVSEGGGTVKGVTVKGELVDFLSAAD